MTRKYSSISVETTLASGISNSATSITVASGTGSALMGGVTLAAGNVDIFTVALDVDTQNEEIVYVTNVSGDTLTVVRGQAGTSAISHTGGATVKHVLTSADLTFYTTGVATADAAIPKSVVTAKADLLVGASSGVVDNLAVGTDGQVLTADSTESLGVKWINASTPYYNLSINEQTGTTYTLVLTDAADLVTLSNAAAITLTVPTNTTVAFPIGTQINLLQRGAGQVTVAPAVGVTINATPGLKLRTQWSLGSLIKLGTNSWVLIGDVAS